MKLVVSATLSSVEALQAFGFPEDDVLSLIKTKTELTDQDFECVYCQDLWVDPVHPANGADPVCAHTFCRKCLEDWKTNCVGKPVKCASKQHVPGMEDNMEG